MATPNRTLVPRQFLHKLVKKVTRPRPAVVLVDADGAPGPVAMSRAMKEAIETARTTGVAWAGVRGTVHTGAIGYYASMAAEAGMAGIGLVAGIPNMNYFGSKAAGVATSPIAIAQLKAAGKPLPEGAAMTEGGQPTTDPALAEIPLPMGGAKGSALSLMIEYLTSGLVNNPIVSSFHSGAPEGRRHRQNGALIAIDPAAFGDTAVFRAMVDAAADAIKKLPAATGVEEVMLPGERGARCFVERSRDGIPVAAGAWKKLLEEAAKLGVAAP